MQQNHNDYSNEKCFRSISKLLDYQFSYESKDSTRQELYEEVFKYKTNLRRQNHQLKREIQQTKENILSRALGLYFAELKELSETNQKLREQHRLIYETKKPVLTQMKEDLYSPLKTPRFLFIKLRSRKSFANIHQNDNSFSKMKILKQRQLQNNFVSRPRKSLNDQNYDSLKPSRIYGRNSLKTSQAPRRNMQQLTERKIMNSTQFLGNYENDISTFSECHSSRASQKSGSRAICFEEKSKNLFTNLIENMLEQQRLKQKQINSILEENSKNFGSNQQQIFVEDLQDEVLKTTNSIQNLQKVLSNYQNQIKYMEFNLTSVTDMTKQLSKVKDNYIQMQDKCKSIGALKVEIATKARKLQEIKQTTKMSYFEPPASIKVMLRLFGVEDQSMNDPSKCKQQVKNLVRGTMEKPTKRRVKVKQLLDTIREGRKKFKELMSVYEVKIKKLEKKLVCFSSESKQV